MATIGRTSGASILNTPRLQYISTAPFNNYFYSYTTSINASLETVGNLNPVADAGPLNCPAGRVLRENGRKLYPSANPGITTYMVGVYDPVTFFNGFIDPNAQVFQIYNTDKPNYLENGVEPTLGTTDLGPSIYTRGSVRAVGTLDISGSSVLSGGLTVRPQIGTGLVVYGGSIINGGQSVNGGQRIYNRLSLATYVNINQNTSTPLNINCSLANVFIITINANDNFTITASDILDGQMIYILYNNAGGNTPTVTMGTNIRGYFNVSEQPIVFSGTASLTQHFMCISGSLCELSRLFIAGS